MIVRLHGGLGNQIFQIVAARYVAQTTQQAMSIYAGDLNNFATKRNFEVQPLLADETTVDRISSLDNLCFKYKVSKMLGRFNIHSVTSVAGLSGYKNQYLNGYFQDVYNYSDTQILGTVVKQLNDQLDSIAPKGNPTIDYSTTCALHLRLTDFIHHAEGKKFLESYRLPYISRAITTMQRDYNIKNFIVFTDDVALAKQYLQNDSITFFNDLQGEKLTLLQEFQTLSSFKYLITSNSTFSFWTSVFGGQKTIVFPELWKHDDKKEDQIFRKNINQYQTLFNTQSEIRIV